MKYLLILIVLAVAWQVWRSRRRQTMQRQMQDMAQQIEHMRQQLQQQMVGDGTTQRAPVTVTVACAHCGVHVPQVEGLYYQGQWYCCEKHAELATLNPPSQRSD